MLRWEMACCVEMRILITTRESELHGCCLLGARGEAERTDKQVLCCANQPAATINCSTPNNPRSTVLCSSSFPLASAINQTDMSTTAIIQGAKIPMAALDGFLRANGLIETAGYPPLYGHGLDDESKLLRAKMAERSGDSNNRIRLFIPYRMGRKKSAFAYVAYDWIFVYGQRKLRLAEELPDAAPEGFSELRDEIMGFGAKGGEGQEQQPKDE